MSRLNPKLLGGALTLLAGIGAWVLGKRVGEKIAKVVRPSPSVPPEEPSGETTDAVEVK